MPDLLQGANFERAIEDIRLLRAAALEASKITGRSLYDDNFRLHAEACQLRCDLRGREAEVVRLQRRIDELETDECATTLDLREENTALRAAVDRLSGERDQVRSALESERACHLAVFEHRDKVISERNELNMRCKLQGEEIAKLRVESAKYRGTLERLTTYLGNYRDSLCSSWLQNAVINAHQTAREALR